MYWNIQEIDAPELAKQLDDADHDYEMIDVREMHEIMRGTVPNAKPMPLATIPLRMHELAKDKKLVMVCHSGARSAQACMYLLQQGYENVINLRGGIMSWARGQLPMALPEAV